MLILAAIAVLAAAPDTTLLKPSDSVRIVIPKVTTRPALDGKLDSQVAAHAFAQIDARFDRVESRFGVMETKFDAALQKGLRQQMGWMILMWISVLAALIART